MYKYPPRLLKAAYPVDLHTLMIYPLIYTLIYAPDLHVDLRVIYTVVYLCWWWAV